MRQGCKHTDVSVAPDDWSIKPIGEIANVSSGGTPSRSVAEYWGGNIPWVTTTQINFRAISETNESITLEGLNNSAAKIFPKGTLLMAMYGQGKTRGKVGILNIDAATNQACAAIQLNQSVSSQYIFQYLISEYKSIRKLSNTGNQENLNGLIIKSINIPLPSLSEQQAIAAVLSDTDQLIATLDKLIAKKQAVKTAVMQQLLTGQTRLPNFDNGQKYKKTEIGLIPEDWKVKKLVEVGTFKKGKNIPKKYLSSQGEPCVLYGEIYTHYNAIAHELKSCIPTHIAKNATPIHFGDVLFAGSGETAEEIGKCVAYVNDETAYAGGDIVILSPALGDSYYWGYILNSPIVNKQKAVRGQGSSVVHIYASGLSTILVPYPSIEEQQAIAKIIKDMDAEITTLEARRDKTKAIKQGMMQELLTGRTRLPLSPS